MIIEYTDEKGYLTEPLLADIEEAAQQVYAREICGDPEQEKAIVVSLTMVEPDEIRTINAEYRNIDRVTDVLSFPQYESADEVRDALDDLEEGMSLMLGDVVICFERASEQAEEYGNSIEREVTYLFVHSLLHLLGYDHMTDTDRPVMREHEERIMSAVGLVRE